MHTLSQYKDLATTPIGARATADAPGPFLGQFKYLATTLIAARRAFAVLGAAQCLL